MTGPQHGTDIDAVIREMRELAREPYEPSPGLLRLRHRIASERRSAHQGILERVAKEAGVDLDPIFREARRRNAAKSRYVTATLERLEPKAVERAVAEKARLHRVRSDYLRAFGNFEQSRPQLKFHQLLFVSGTAQPGECGVIMAGPCSEPDLGTFDAAADTGPDPAGIWLFPLVRNDNGDCDETRPGRTFHELTYLMDPPDASFAVDSVRVDLIGNGVATSAFGDAGTFSECNSQYVHSFIDMHVSIAQLVDGAWQHLPLLSDRLFAGQGEYARQVRLVLSAQTYPATFAVRKPDGGGGQLMCQLELVCSAQACGSDGRNAIDFRQRDLGIFLGGVSLLGTFI